MFPPERLLRQGDLADYGHEPVEPTPVVVETDEVEAPTAGVLVDVADDEATARVGLNHAADARSGLVGELVLEGVEGGFGDRPVGVVQIATRDLGDDFLDVRVAIEVVRREDGDRHLAIGGIDREVASPRRLVAVCVLRRLDPLPARIAAPHHHLDDPETTGVGSGLEGRLPLLEEGLQGGTGDGCGSDLEMQLGELLNGRLHDDSTLLIFQYTPVVLKSPHSCMTVSKQNAVRSHAPSRKRSEID